MKIKEAIWGRRQPPEEPPPEDGDLPEEYWPEVGVYKDPSTGVVTHHLGDEHARRIVEREIDYQKAKKEQQRVDRQIEGAARRRKLSRQYRRSRPPVAGRKPAGDPAPVGVEAPRRGPAGRQVSRRFHTTEKEKS